MENIILTLLDIPKIGRKSVNCFIESMKDKPKNENDIVDIFINIKTTKTNNHIVLLTNI